MFSILYTLTYIYSDRGMRVFLFISLSVYSFTLICSDKGMYMLFVYQAIYLFMILHEYAMLEACDKHSFNSYMYI